MGSGKHGIKHSSQAILHPTVVRPSTVGRFLDPNHQKCDRRYLSRYNDDSDHILWSKHVRPDDFEMNDFCTEGDALVAEMGRSTPRSQLEGLEARQILEPLTNLELGKAGPPSDAGPITPKTVDAPDVGVVSAPSVEVPELPLPLKLLRVRPDKAPDCFGRLTLFDATSSDCSTCPFAGECCHISERNVRLLGGWRDWCSSAGDDVAVE